MPACVHGLNAIAALLRLGTLTATLALATTALATAHALPLRAAAHAHATRARTHLRTAFHLDLLDLLGGLLRLGFVETCSGVMR